MLEDFLTYMNASIMPARRSTASRRRASLRADCMPIISSQAMHTSARISIAISSSTRETPRLAEMRPHEVPGLKRLIAAETQSAQKRRGLKRPLRPCVSAALRLVFIKFPFRYWAGVTGTTSPPSAGGSVSVGGSSAPSPFSASSSPSASSSSLNALTTRSS